MIVLAVVLGLLLLVLLPLLAATLAALKFIGTVFAVVGAIVVSLAVTGISFAAQFQLFGMEWLGGSAALAGLLGLLTAYVLLRRIVQEVKCGRDWIGRFFSQSRTGRTTPVTE